MSRESTKCLNPSCASKRSARGLCHACYQTASRLIRLGKTSWDRLESSGKCLPLSGPVERTKWLLGKQSRRPCTLPYTVV